MPEVVKTVRVSEDEGVYLGWYQDQLGLTTFSNTFRVLVKRHRDNLTPQEDREWRLFLREQRQRAEAAAPPTIKDPDHCAHCGKGDIWFTWYPVEQEGICQGCGERTYRDAAA